MDESEARPQAEPADVVNHQKRERALDQALDQSFPASDTPSILRPHPRADAGGARPHQ